MTIEPRLRGLAAQPESKTQQADPSFGCILSDLYLHPRCERDFEKSYAYIAAAAFCEMPWVVRQSARDRLSAGRCDTLREPVRG